MEPETLREVLLLWLGQQNWRLVLGSFPVRESPSSAVSSHLKLRSAANVHVPRIRELAQHSERRGLGLAEKVSSSSCSYHYKASLT